MNRTGLAAAARHSRSEKKIIKKIKKININGWINIGFKHSFRRLYGMIRSGRNINPHRHKSFQQEQEQQPEPPRIWSVAEPNSFHGKFRRIKKSLRQDQPFLVVLKRNFNCPMEFYYPTSPSQHITLMRRHQVEHFIFIFGSIFHVAFLLCVVFDVQRFSQASIQPPTPPCFSTHPLSVIKQLQPSISDIFNRYIYKYRYSIDCMCGLSIRVDVLSRWSDFGCEVWP